jgi:lycopene cyclase domain-containing protein
MTYFGFLLRFLFLPILVFQGIAIWDHRQRRPAPGFDDRKAPYIIAAHVLLALVYTTPWDNYLVATGVWNYNPQLVTGIVFGYVPLEEYTFFVVETILSGLWWWFLARRLALPSPQPFKPNRKMVYWSTLILLVAWLFFTAQFFLGPDSWNYLGIIFFWALPAILPQFLFGADILWHYRKLVFWAVFVPGLYLSLADIVALRATTWVISPAQTTGVLFFGNLPLEEMAFFFVTNTLIAFGMTLMLSNIGWRRFTDWKSRNYKGLP